MENLSSTRAAFFQHYTERAYELQVKYLSRTGRVQHQEVGVGMSVQLVGYQFRLLLILEAAS